MTTATLGSDSAGVLRTPTAVNAIVVLKKINKNKNRHLAKVRFYFALSAESTNARGLMDQAGENTIHNTKWQIESTNKLTAS